MRILIFIFLNFVASYAQATECADAYGLFLKYQQDPTVTGELLLQKRLLIDQDVILDIGGEGRYQEAINLNPVSLTSTTGESGRLIPNWLPGSGANIPLPNNVADLIYLENAPITLDVMKEMLRVIRPRGSIRLSHPTDYANKYLADVFNTFGKENVKIFDDLNETRVLIQLD